jgi:hypothetical protein
VAQNTLTVKQLLLAQMSERFRDLMRQVESMRELGPSPDGTWCAFEVLSHICGWHLRSADRLRRLARGEEDNPPDDEDRINAGYVAERRSLGADGLRTALAASFADLEAAVAEMPEAAFWRGGPGEEDSLPYFIAAANSHEHYEEHLPALVASLR